MEWEVIDSAPKDKPILGFADGDMAVVEWHKPMYSKGHGYWNLVVCGSYAEDGEWTPELWKQCPEPPS